MNIWKVFWWFYLHIYDIYVCFSFDLLQGEGSGLLRLFGRFVSMCSVYCLQGGLGRYCEKYDSLWLSSVCTVLYMPVFSKFCFADASSCLQLYLYNIEVCIFLWSFLITKEGSNFSKQFISQLCKRKVSCKFSLLCYLISNLLQSWVSFSNKLMFKWLETTSE